MDPGADTEDEPESAPPRVSDPREKALLCVGLLIYCFGGYYGIAYVQTGPGASLRTSLDDAIPFVPAFMWAYFIVYTSLFVPVFTVRCRRLFRRTAQAYFAVLTVCLISWAVFPVTATHLRPDVSGLDTSWFHLWGLRVNYALDPPTNLFPSMHVAIAVVATLAAYTASRLWGLLASIPTVLVCASICLVKQHFVVDGIAGAAIAVTVWALMLRGHPSEHAAGATYTWRGPASYVVLHLSALICLKIAHVAGWKPYL